MIRTADPSILWQLANLLRDLQRLLNALHPYPCMDTPPTETVQAAPDDWLFPELRDCP